MSSSSTPKHDVFLSFRGEDTRDNFISHLYAEAFIQHQHRFKDKMDAWKSALTQVAGLSGWDSRVIRPEHTLVEHIVKDISRKLDCSFVSDNYEGLIGIEQHIEQIQSLLHLESAPVRIVGIWGMGGIEKTTIASAIFRKLETQFNSSCIVLNVQQEIERVGVHRLRSKFISKLLGEDITSSELSFSYDRRLKQTRVLLVLDCVNNLDQHKDLIGTRSNFGQGSRIIVTTRDLQVLKNADADEIYEVKEMNFQDSLRLFSLNAFKQNHHVEAYADLSVNVLNYAKGVPLALKVLGFLLRGRTREAWESELQKLEKLPDNEIFKVLKLSYARLDEEQQDMFLDIACFYRGHLENVVAQTLHSYGFSAHIGMEVLKDRCLISILEGRIVMHDLIKEMGFEIVRQQCVKHPGKRSRLWKPEEIYHVLKKNNGTDAIQCIFLDMCKITKVQLHPKTFKKMHNLRMLEFYTPAGLWKDSNVILPAFLESLPDDLKFLRWDGFPQKSLPLDFCPENLVKLDMPHSHLEHLWEGDQDLPNLKRLDLHGSRKLIKIPDLAQCPNIEELILSHCTRLAKVHSSSFLIKLKCVWFNGCDGLWSLHIPSNILSTTSGLIVLHKCHNLEMFSVSNANTRVLSYRRPCVSKLVDIWGKQKRLSNTLEPLDCAELNKEPKDNIELLKLQVLREGSASLFPSLNELCWLDLSYCESLTSLPNDIFKLKFLKRLYLWGCPNLEKFPEIEETMENLTVLILDRTPIKELPSSLHRLVSLEELGLDYCFKLETIPASIGSLSKLCKLDLTFCDSLETFPSSIFKLKLTKLNLYGCSMLSTIPEILEPVETLANVDLTRTAIKELPASLGYLVGLQTLCLNSCSDLVSLPHSIGNLSHLSQLDCSGCRSLTEIPNSIGNLSSLSELSLQESSIVNLPESIVHLSSLKSLDISDCKMLECIPQLPPLLNHLSAFDCPSIKRVMPNSRLELPSNSKKDTFKFHLTNGQELDSTASGNIGAEAWLRINQDAYRSVFFCFPGSAVPHWFPYRCRGNSVTMENDSPYMCNESRLVGFAMCVIWECVDMDHTGARSCSFTLTFESDGHSYILPNCDKIKNYFYWKGQRRYLVQDQTFLWKYQLDFANMDNRLFDAHSFTFEFSNSVKECGICPLYAKEKDDRATITF